jgi:predicted HD superfamily hydrolase involved in NAD metabolism
MIDLLAQLKRDATITGNVRTDVPAFLIGHGQPKTAGHCAAVALEARRVADMVGEDQEKAGTGGWLHDVSVIIPNEQRIEAAQAWGVEILPEEETFPMIIHQKLSVVLAREVFGVRDETVLSAIGCHTTLKAGASHLDKVVFIADKIAWDQPGQPPYLDELLAGLERSLDEGVFVYINYLWAQRATLKVVHPWLVDAYEALKPA